MELPPETPFTAHVTPVAELPAPETVAVKVCAPPAVTVVVAGEMVIVMLSVNVRVATALARGSASLTAVTVTAVIVGKIAGA